MPRKKSWLGAAIRRAGDILTANAAQAAQAQRRANAPKAREPAKPKKNQNDNANKKKKANAGKKQKGKIVGYTLEGEAIYGKEMNAEAQVKRGKPAREDGDNHNQDSEKEANDEKKKLAAQPGTIIMGIGAPLIARMGGDPGIEGYEPEGESIPGIENPYAEV